VTGSPRTAAVRRTPALGSARGWWDNRVIMSQKPVLPTGRAAVFTVVCVLLAVAVHSWMSGAAVPPWAVLAGLVPVFVTARLASGRERSLGAILLLMGLDQTALHLLFEAAQQHAAAMADTITSPAAIIVQLPSMPMPGMSMPGMSTAGVSMSGMPMSGMNMSGMGMYGMSAPGVAAKMQMTPGMLAMHAMTALVCAWWLRRGEATVHALVGTVAAWIADKFRLPRPDVRPIRLGPDAFFRGSRPTVPSTRLLRFALARRGPPLPLSI
jgi:hypothetical protein